MVVTRSLIVALKKSPYKCNGKKFMCNFYLGDIEGSMLLGLPKCEALKIVSREKWAFWDTSSLLFGSLLPVIGSRTDEKITVKTL